MVSWGIGSQDRQKGSPVGRKRDLREVDQVASQYGMDLDGRRAFGDYLEDCKRCGDCGTKNDRGDFTWDELERKARDFLGLNG